MTDPLIRPATPEDAAAIAAIYEPYVRETAITFEEDPPDADAMRQRIEATTRTYPWLVACIDNAPVGYACASPHHARASYRWSVDTAIYIAHDHHRRGVGRALYAALLPILARQGFVTAYAGATLPNPASVALHESMGFRKVAVYRNVGYKLGAWRDVIWWSLQLNPPPPSPAEPIPWPQLRGEED